MAQAQAANEALEILNKLAGRRRLLALIRTMAREIQRLEEDNVQLRCAVDMYREAIRRGTGRDAPATWRRTA